jgi:TatD DNase family protein
MAEAPPPECAGRRLVCAVSAADWPVVADWAERWPGTVPAFGIHPWSAGDAAIDGGGWEEALEKFLLRFPAAWIGEIGLDAAKAARVPMERQREVLVRQLRISARLRRPVNLHCVRAAAEILSLMDAEYFLSFPPGRGTCILHSFAGSANEAEAFARRGAYFSVGPLFVRRDSPKLRARIAALPAERLLLESDAFLEPGVDAVDDLLLSLRWLAEVRNVSLEHMTERLAENARNL